MGPSSRQRAGEGARVSHGDRRRLALAAFAVLGLMPILMAFIGARIGQDFREEHRMRIAARAIVAHRSALQDVFNDLLQAETGQRGYLLTRRDLYLDPYERAKGAIPARLETLVAASPDAASRAEAQRLAMLSRRKLAELGQTIDLEWEGRHAEALALVQTDIGQQTMDQIRALATEGRAHDDAQILNRSAAADRADAATGRAALIVAGVMMLTLFAATWIVIASFRDRRKALDEVVDSEMRYRLVTENATDVIIRTDPGGAFTFVSPSSEALLGYAPEALIGRPLFSLAHPDDLPRLREQYAASAAAGPDAPPLVVLTRMIRKDGRVIWVEGKPKLVRDGDGRPEAAFDVLRDVTERQELELNLERARGEALAAAEAKGQFLANMSHELRTPLTAIIGFGNLLAEQAALPPTARQYLQRIQTASDALLATVNDVLDFSKLEAGQVDICPWPTKLGEFVETVHGIVADQARVKTIALEIVADLPDNPVEIDPDRVRQVLLNLLSNAIKFTDQGSIRLEVRHADDRLACRVIDTGSGIPEDKIGHLFQRFSQVDGSSTRRVGGTGLGLAICKGLVEAMGGTIRVESRVGQGSVFWFDIDAPLARDQAGSSDQALAGDVRDLADIRVLVVDDTLFNRDFTAAILAAQGCEVHTASCGEEALTLTDQAVFDVILIDRHMPGLDGCALARRIRASNGPNATAWLLAYSADVLTAAEEIFDGELAKPVTPADLITAVAHGCFPSDDSSTSNRSSAAL